MELIQLLQPHDGRKRGYMSDKRMIRFLAAVMTGVMVSASVYVPVTAGASMITGGEPEEHKDGIENDPLYKQIAKESRGSGEDDYFEGGAAEVLLTDVPVALAKGESFSISNLDRKFTAKEMKKKKASVTVTPLISNPDPSQDPVSIKNGTVITAVAPYATAVKVKYTWHKPKVTKKVVKKNGKKKTVKKKVFGKKTYSRVWLLEVVSCYDTDQTQMAPDTAADPIYNQKNYERLRTYIYGLDEPFTTDGDGNLQTDYDDVL